MMDCAICFERINVDQKLLRCGHQFHGECVDQWLCQRKCNSCPLCRTPVIPRQQNDSPSPDRSMALDDTEDEEDRYEEDETYETISEDEIDYSGMATDDDGEVTEETSRSATVSDTVEESMDLESISSSESFSSNEFEDEANDSEETEEEELVTDGQTS